jgi:hypothetical protein
VLGVLVDLPFVPHRSVCLPILARLWRPGHTPGRLDLAVDLLKVVCGHLGTRRVDLTCDAALHRLAPPRRPAPMVDPAPAATGSPS